MTETEPLPNVFGLQTAANLFRKLLWERDQFHNLMAPENYRRPDVTPMYVAYNCAITAWHLIDWIWEDATDQQKQALADRYGFTTGSGRRGFSNALCLQMPELAACHDIANGSKHFDLTRPKSTVKVEADFAIVVDPSHTGLKPGDHLLTLHVWLPDRNMTAQVFFDTILAFLHEVMRGLGMFDSAKYLIDLLPVPTFPHGL